MRAQVGVIDTGWSVSGAEKIGLILIWKWTLRLPRLEHMSASWPGISAQQADSKVDIYMQTDVNLRVWSQCCVIFFRAWIGDVIFALNGRFSRLSAETLELSHETDVYASAQVPAFNYS